MTSLDKWDFQTLTAVAVALEGAISASDDYTPQELKLMKNALSDIEERQEKHFRRG